MITQTDIKKRLKAGYYFQLALDSAPEWDETASYSIGDVREVRSDSYVTEISFRSLVDLNIDNDPIDELGVENPTYWEEYSEIVNQCIEESNLFVEAFVINRNHDFDDTNKFQKQAILLYACGLLIDSANQMTNSDSEDSAGMDEKTRATTILDNAFQMKTADSPTQSPIAYISNANGAVRTLAEVDPNSYYNKNYNSNDLGK